MTNRLLLELKRDDRQAFKKAEAVLVEHILNFDPVLGTQLGLSGAHDSLLPPSNGSVRARLIKRMKSASASFHPGSYAKTTDNIIDSELAASGVSGLEILENAIRPTDHDPSWYVNNALSAIHALLFREDMPPDIKIEFLLSRMNAVPQHFKNAIRQIKSPPRVLVETAAGDTGGALTFYRDELRRFIDSVSGKGARRALMSAQKAGLKSLSGFATHLERLEENSVDQFAIGREAFNALLKELHRLPYDCDDLLALGHETAHKLELMLQRRSKIAAGHPRWWQVLRPLSRRHPTARSLLAGYRGMVEDARRFSERRKLVDLSNAALLVQPTPAFARTNLPFAAYIPAPPFASNGRAQFWVTPLQDGLDRKQTEAALSVHHLGRILVACVHEAYPGHHVQFSHAFKVKRPLRHIFASTVFVEGWAFYIEELMRKEKFKRDEKSYRLLEMSQLRDQLWRALRVVLDVELHCNGMSQGQAAQLLVDKHVLEPASAAAEVMYYCSAPTQPMSYMVGRLMLEDLIEKCRARGGDRFSSQYRTHNEILSHGSLPFPLLERALGIDQRKR